MYTLESKCHRNLEKVRLFLLVREKGFRSKEEGQSSSLFERFESRRTLGDMRRFYYLGSERARQNIVNPSLHFL